jgi:hypothetical protein
MVKLFFMPPPPDSEMYFDYTAAIGKHFIFLPTGIKYSSENHPMERE